jgi:hypothetical protein
LQILGLYRMRHAQGGVKVYPELSNKNSAPSGGF